MSIEKNVDILAIQKIVDTAVGKPRYSYAMYQNAPRPPQVEKYAAIRIHEVKNPGYDEHEHIEKAGKLIFRTMGIREVTADILFNRDDSDVVVFDNAFFRPDVQEVCFLQNMELLRKSPTNLRNRNLETSWEIRTGITCVFSTIRIQESVIGVVDTAGVTGILDSSDSSTNVNMNIDLT